MEVIPVLDIMNGLVVHAIAGHREKYRPIENSVISDNPYPSSILSGLKNLGFTTVYIADLDAIMKRGDNTDVINMAERLNFKVLADIGRRGLNLLDKDKVVYVIGTEYIEYPIELKLLENRAISIDMYGDHVLFSNTRVKINEVLKDLRSIEYKKVLAIDLSRVGTELGVNKSIASKLTEYFPGKVIVGGGVKNEYDILELKNLGVTGVLVATAIHRGIIRKPTY